MQQISRMAAEVNKLIGLNLLEEGAIYLPEIGSLFTTEGNGGAKRIDFSSSEQGSSLVEVISERAECTSEQASVIFGRWLDEVRTAESVIVIDGVGELRQKSFVAAPSFLNQLKTNTETKIDNTMEDQQQKQQAEAPTPKSTKAPEKKRNNKGILILLLIIVIAIAGYFVFTSIQESRAEKAAIEAAAKHRAAEQQRIADSIAVAQIEAKRIAAEAEAAAEAASPRYRWVYGIYELRSNVDVAITKINKLYGEGSAKEYPFGSYTMVSMFESNDRNECQKLLMDNYDTFPEAWIYDSEQ